MAFRERQSPIAILFITQVRTAVWQARFAAGRARKLASNAAFPAPEAEKPASHEKNLGIDDLAPASEANERARKAESVRHRIFFFVHRRLFLKCRRLFLKCRRLFLKCRRLFLKCRRFFLQYSRFFLQCSRFFLQYSRFFFQCCRFSFQPRRSRLHRCKNRSIRKRKSQGTADRPYRTGSFRRSRTSSHRGQVTPSPDVTRISSFEQRSRVNGPALSW